MKNLSLLILMLLLHAFPSMATVKYSEQEFFINHLSKDATTFWGKVSGYDQWTESERSRQISLDPHPQYTAIAEGHADSSSPDVTPADIDAALMAPISDEYLFYINQRDEDYYRYQQARDFAPQTALVFELKFAKTISKSIDPSQLNMDKLVQILKAIDTPHNHQRVSQTFGHQVLEKTHSGHRLIEEMNPDNSALIFSTIRMQDYNCSILKNLIATMSEWQGESVLEKDGEKVVNIFTLAVIKKITDAAKLSQWTEVFGKQPDFLLSQEFAFASRFVKDMGNYWAFFNNADGSTTVMSYTLVATSTKFRHALDVVLNGPTAYSIAAIPGNLAGDKIADTGSKILEEADKALDSLFGGGGSSENVASSGLKGFPQIINATMVDLSTSESPSSCQSGLALGLPFYTKKLFDGMIEQM